MRIFWGFISVTCFLLVAIFLSVGTRDVATSIPPPIEDPPSVSVTQPDTRGAAVANVAPAEPSQVTVHDLGTRQAGTNFTTQLKIVNLRPEPARIKVETSCGCTNPSYPDTLAANESTVIEFEVAVPHDRATQKVDVNIYVAGVIERHRFEMNIDGYTLPKQQGIPAVADGQGATSRPAWPAVVTFGRFDPRTPPAGTIIRTLHAADGVTFVEPAERAAPEDFSVGGTPVAVRQVSPQEVEFRADLRDVDPDARRLQRKLLRVSVRRGAEIIDLEVPVVMWLDGPVPENDEGYDGTAREPGNHP